MFKSILSVVAGYLAMAMLVMLMFGALALALPDTFGADPTRPPGTGVTLVVLALGFVAAVAGGWLSARLAPRRPWKHVLWLAGVVGTLSLASWAAGAESGTPVWYQAGLAILGVAGVLLGGRVRVARIDRLAAAS